MLGLYSDQSWWNLSTLHPSRTSLLAKSLSSIVADESMQTRILTLGARSSEYVPGPDPTSRTQSDSWTEPVSNSLSTILCGVSPWSSAL